MIVDDTPEAHQVLKSFISVEASMLPHALSFKMIAEGYYSWALSSSERSVASLQHFLTRMGHCTQVQPDYITQ